MSAFAYAPTVVRANEQTRADRLIALDATYRSQGWESWLKAAGVTCTAVVEARQPEEETVVSSAGETRVVVSGIQINGTCNVPYPAIVTTDQPSYITTGSDTRQYQPDLRNPSVLYTNVDAHGPVTIWVDGSNWGQLAPVEAVSEVPVISAPAEPSTPSTPATPAGPNAWQRFWSGVGTYFDWSILGLIALALLVGLPLLYLLAALLFVPSWWPWRQHAVVQDSVNGIRTRIANRRKPTKKTKKPVTDYTTVQLKAAVTSLTEAQATALNKAFPTKESLKSASVAEIRSAGKMGDAKAKLVKDATL